MTASRPAWVQALPRATSLVSGGVAILALAGWVLNAPVLRSGVPGLVGMNPVTALTLLLAASALWLQGVADPSPRAMRLARGAAIAVAVIGLLKIGDYAFGWALPFDQVLFTSPLDGAAPRPMPPNTAVCFCLLGVGLATLRFRSRGVATAVFITPVFLLALLALLGYTYGTRTLYEVSTFTPMALTSAVAFSVLCLGVLASRVSGPLLDVIAGSGIGTTARWLILATVVIPAALGWLRLRGERAGLYDTAIGTALFAAATTGLLLVLVRWHTLSLHRSETARASAERTLRDSERRLFQILEQVPLGVFVVDAAGHPYFANRVAQSILGKGIDPAANLADLPDVYHTTIAGTNTRYPVERQAIARALAGERAHSADVEIHAPAGVVPIEVWAAPVYDGDGRLVHAIAAFHDISERQRARREIDALTGRLQQQVTELEVVNQELETFSYSVSHDLRAPLRAITGFSRILVEDHASALDPSARRLLAVIQENAGRMAQLIDDLLSFSRFSRQRLERLPVDMDGLVRTVVADLRQSVPGSGTDVVIDPLPSTHGDAPLIRQVWANLIGNAVKYSARRAAPRVDIGARSGPLPGGCAYFVRDNGVGFDMAHAGKLFGVFQRLHRQDEFEGTGVGLAIVQRIVHRHGGRVWAEAEPDRGATFFFTLPAMESRA